MKRSQMGKPSIDELRNILSYQSEDGVLVWKRRNSETTISSEKLNTSYIGRWNDKYAGSVASSNKGGDYLAVTIGRRRHFAHRVIYAIVYGEWPIGMIDHIDGNTKNNKISNLRLVNNKINSRNKSISKNNKSGHIGVIWHKSSQKWNAQIKVDGVNIYIGSFDKIEEAREARILAQAKYGFHAGHGRRRHEG